MTVKIYHNPKCSKSRATLQLIQDKGIEPEIILYLDTPPSASELKNIIALLGIDANELVRFKDPAAKELGIKTSDDKTAAAWVKLMISTPKLIERPIVVKGKKAIIGRPPENVNAII